MCKPVHQFHSGIAIAVEMELLANIGLFFVPIRTCYEGAVIMSSLYTTL